MPRPEPIELKSGTIRYRVRYRIGRDQKVTTFVSRKQADDYCKLIDAVGAQRAKIIADESSPEIVMSHTLGAVGDMWLAWKGEKNSKGVYKQVTSGYTVTRYGQLFNKHIKPALGHMPINVVSEADVQALIDRLSDDLAPKTVCDIHSVLHGIYKWAMAKQRLLAINDPCTETELPKKKKQVVKGLKPAEWSILQRAAQEVDPDAADLLLFLVSTGWRWSEAVAVRPMELDEYDDGNLFVNMGRVLRRDGNKFEFVEDESKSQVGFRRTKITGQAAEMVRRRRAGLKPTDLLFTNRKGSRWDYAYFHNYVWSRPPKDLAPNRGRIVERAQQLGLTKHVTPHMLRHTHAVMMILSGENLPAIQRRLGHEDIGTTVKVYGSMISDVSDSALEAVEAMLNGAARRPAPVVHATADDAHVAGVSAS